MSALRICIVGAGPSGVVALKALLSESPHFVVKVLERRTCCGGVWNYDALPTVHTAGRPDTATAKYENHADMQNTIHVPASPMYDDLHTNIPAALMAYNGFPFPANTEDFPDRQTVLEYLQRYASDVEHLINFSSHVTSIVKNKARNSWMVKYRQADVQSRCLEVEEEFDRVILASGHYEVPRIPRFPGLDDFKHKFPSVLSHSSSYRAAESFRDLKTLVIGCGPSGTDIASQIAEVASHPVLRSVRSTIKSPSLPDSRIEDVADIRSFNHDGSISLQDGRTLDGVQKVLCCTGYLYSYPFLNLGSDPSQNVITTGERVRNVYDFVFYIHDTSLAFLTNQVFVIPFPIAQAQACYLARVWNSKLLLPSPDDMTEVESQLVDEKGDSRKYMSLGHPEDGEYIERLRTACLKADCEDESVATGMLPPVWQGQRSHLREHTKSIKEEWLRTKFRSTVRAA